MASNGDGTEAGEPADGRGSGWNDPPASQYSSTPRGSLPRKRVPYPSQSNGTPSGNCDLLNPSVTSPSSTLTSSNAVSPRVMLFPPLHGTDPSSSYTAPLIIPTLSGCSMDGSIATNPVTAASIAVKTSFSEAELDVPEFEDDEQMFHYVVTRLQRALKDCQSAADPRAAEEMSKKVNIFSDMWKNGKISYPVKSAMARLATAIHKRRCDAAHDLVMSLMVDHVSEVSRWLVGVKRLVQEVQNVEAPLSPSSDCHISTNTPSLIDVQPSLIQACGPTAITTNCQSSDVTSTSPHVTSNSDAHTGTAEITPVAKNPSTDVSSLSGLVTSEINSQHSVMAADSCELMTEGICPTFTSDVNIVDSDADKKPVVSVSDTTSSRDEAAVLSASDTHVDSDDAATSADMVSVDDAATSADTL